VYPYRGPRFTVGYAPSNAFWTGRAIAVHAAGPPHNILHEFGHYLAANPDERWEINFGIRGGKRAEKCEIAACHMQFCLQIAIGEPPRRVERLAGEWNFQEPLAELQRAGWRHLRRHEITPDVVARVIGPEWPR
jgi:hypothetical protein